METLDRFIQAQEEKYQIAFNEICSGLKQSDWMWYIFPQIDGLVEYPSFNTRLHSIKSKEEAIDYLGNPILKERLIEITQKVLNLNTDNIQLVFGKTDSKKLKSCMTLFDFVAGDQIDLFDRVLNNYYKGKRDKKTLKLITPNL